MIDVPVKLPIRNCFIIFEHCLASLSSTIAKKKKKKKKKEDLYDVLALVYFRYSIDHLIFEPRE